LAWLACDKMWGGDACIALPRCSYPKVLLARDVMHLIHYTKIL